MIEYEAKIEYLKGIIHGLEEREQWMLSNPNQVEEARYTSPSATGGEQQRDEENGQRFLSFFILNSEFISFSADLPIFV